SKRWSNSLAAAPERTSSASTCSAATSELLHRFDPLPQLLKNVRFKGGKPLEDAGVKDAIAAAEAELEAKGGRLLIRASGTEPVIRVMAEGDEAGHIETVVDRVCEAVRKAAG
ncbi:MAG: phosphoglucosamine mutase, partial [Sphingomonadales bacterium]